MQGTGWGSTAFPRIPEREITHRCLRCGQMQADHLDILRREQAEQLVEQRLCPIATSGARQDFINALTLNEFGWSPGTKPIRCDDCCRDLDKKPGTVDALMIRGSAASYRCRGHALMAYDHSDKAAIQAAQALVAGRAGPACRNCDGRGCPRCLGSGKEPQPLKTTEEELLGSTTAEIVSAAAEYQRLAKVIEDMRLSKRAFKQKIETLTADMVQAQNAMDRQYDRLSRMVKQAATEGEDTPAVPALPAPAAAVSP